MATVRGGAEIVRDDSLILYMDAGRSSVNSSTVIWTNLIGGENNATLESGATYSSDGGGSIETDGVNDYIDLSSVASDLSTADTGTLDIWFKASSLDSSGYLIRWTGPTNGQGNIFIGNSTGGYADESIAFIVQPSPGTEVRWYHRNGHTFYFDDIWHNLVVVVDGVDGKFYVDGVEVTMTYGFGNATTKSFMNIADLNSIRMGFVGTFPINCKYGSIKIYNRGLSESEVTQNFKTLKGRYGL
jgi:hypothetical protein